MTRTEALGHGTDICYRRPGEVLLRGLRLLNGEHPERLQTDALTDIDGLNLNTLSGHGTCLINY